MNDDTVWIACLHAGCRETLLGVPPGHAFACREHRGDVVPADVVVEPGACTDGFVLVPVDLLHKRESEV